MGPTPFLISAGVHPGAGDPSMEGKRLVEGLSAQDDQGSWERRGFTSLLPEEL